MEVLYFVWQYHSGNIYTKIQHGLHEYKNKIIKPIKNQNEQIMTIQPSKKCTQKSSSWLIK